MIEKSYAWTTVALELKAVILQSLLNLRTKFYKTVSDIPDQDTDYKNKLLNIYYFLK